MIRLRQRWIEAHNWIKEIIIGYIEWVIPLYRQNIDKYGPNIGKFLANLEAHLTSHHRFEEESIFPFLPERRIIEEITREHREIERFISFLRRKDELTINDILHLRDMMKIHLVKENNNITPLLDIS